MGEGGGLRKREAGKGRGLLDGGEEGETGPWEGSGDRAVGGERDLRKAIGFPSKESFSF